QDKYILVWSGTDEAIPHRIFGCLLDIDALPLAECNSGNAVHGIASDFEVNLAISLDPTSPTRLHVTFTHGDFATDTGDIRAKSINADLSGISPNTSTAISSGVFAQWLNVFPDTSRNRFSILASTSSTDEPTVTTLPLATFPNGTAVTDRLAGLVGPMNVWQPQSVHFPGAGVFVVRSETPGGLVNWTAFDAGFVAGAAPSQTAFSEVPGFS